MLTAATLLTGCSSFNRDWKRLQNVPSPRGLEGPWDGSWESAASGHQGRLRCIIVRNEAEQYAARFHANFWKIFTYNYTVPLRVQERAEQFHFAGEARLGWWAGGLYSYEGNATATNFFSTYLSKSDHGTFRLHRP